LKKLADYDRRIEILGRVEDVRPFVVKSGIFVVPLRIGGGTRLKILEAMAMEKAVVSTSIGAEGIQYTDGKDILIADKPKQFSRYVLDLLENPQMAQKIGQAGREMVCSKYDWNIVGKKLVEVYEKVVYEKKP